jgi:transposase-like protein
MKARCNNCHKTFEVDNKITLNDLNDLACIYCKKTGWIQVYKNNGKKDEKEEKMNQELDKDINNKIKKNRKCKYDETVINKINTLYNEGKSIRAIANTFENGKPGYAVIKRIIKKSK